MITNKDLSIDSKNGKVTLNGNKYDLGTQGEIDAAVKDVYSVMGQMGAKNLIPYPFPSDSYSQRGIEFTALSDGTINANGTNDGTGNSTFNFVSFTLSKGSYALNGCPAQTDNNYRCGLIRVSDGTTLVSDYGNGANLTLDADTDVRAFVQVMSGKTADNITFKPMLRLAADTDNTYEPYAMTNKQLTDQLATKQDTLTFDNTPTASSTNPVTSGGVKSYVDDLIKTEYLTGTIETIAGNTDTTVAIPLNVPSGYKVIGASEVLSSSRSVAVTAFYTEQNNVIKINCANLYSAALTNVTIGATLIYVRN